MAWGKRKQETGQSPVSAPASTRTAPAGSASEISIFGPSLVVTGEVAGDQNLRIMGKIVGKIVGKAAVHVAATGTIEGDVVCDTLLVEGCVRGNVDAATNITIEASGKLYGDITTKEFINRPGGFFEGYSHMMHTSTQAEEAPKKTSKNAKQHEKVGTA